MNTKTFTARPLIAAISAPVSLSMDAAVSFVMERWSEITGFPLYMVSDSGYIRHKVNGALNPFLNKKGYLKVKLYTGKKYKTFSVHRLVGNAFVPNPDNLPQIDHKDTIKTNNKSGNLQWVTNFDNMQLSWKRGTHKASFGNLRYGSTKIKNVRTDWIAGLTQKDIAAKHKVSTGTVYNMTKGILR